MAPSPVLGLALGLLTQHRPLSEYWIICRTWSAFFHRDHFDNRFKSTKQPRCLVECEYNTSL